MSTPAQTFIPVPTVTGLYDRERDLEVVYAADKSIQDLLTVTAEEREHQKNLVISRISSGGLFVNEVQVG